ncbi:hypothetical protein AGMMS49975_26270 [Clostridia bacterium]|nr:hypothetical protein AGMMS49975_26270 [Clostridia bacterium]
MVLACKDAIAISVIAKDYGWSARKMNAVLNDHGVQFRQGNIWMLYKRHAEMGYTVTKTHTHTGGNDELHSSVHTYWTQKGRLFIYELMKFSGNLPTIEQAAA